MCKYYVQLFCFKSFKFLPSSSISSFILSVLLPCWLFVQHYSHVVYYCANYCLLSNQLSKYCILMYFKIFCRLFCFSLWLLFWMYIILKSINQFNQSINQSIWSKNVLLPAAFRVSNPSSSRRKTSSGSMLRRLGIDEMLAGCWWGLWLRPSPIPGWREAV